MLEDFFKLVDLTRNDPSAESIRTTGPWGSLYKKIKYISRHWDTDSREMLKDLFAYCTLTLRFRSSCN